jgi:hypothetical protein
MVLMGSLLMLVWESVETMVGCEVVEVDICSMMISKWVCVVYWRLGVVGACGNRDDYDGDAGEAECMVCKAYIYITHRWYQGK